MEPVDIDRIRRGITEEEAIEELERCGQETVGRFRSGNIRLVERRRAPRHDPWWKDLLLSAKGAVVGGLSGAALATVVFILSLLIYMWAEGLFWP